MNYFDLYSSYPDHTVTAAWDCQMTEAAQTPWLKELLLRRGSDLFPRFAVCYAELRAMPRSARRAVQRRIGRSGELPAIFPGSLQRSALQQRLARSLAGAALLLALASGVATAATITVTTKDPRVVPDGQCSLIEAIVNANADAAFFSDCPAGSGADTIVLPAKANVRLGDVYDNTYGPTGLPLITSPITIQGNGARIRGQGNAFRLLAVSISGDLTLENLTLTNGAGMFNNGFLTIDNSTISGNVSFRGGVVSNHGSLTIQNSSLSRNPDGAGGVVSNGGLVYIGYSSMPHPFKSGPFCFYYYNYTFNPHIGGVYCNYYLYSGVVTVANSTISKNSGVAIFNQSGTVTIANSNISGNRGGSLGGGAFNFGGSLDFYGTPIPGGNMSFANSTISKNSAEHGGGIFNRGAVTIENSTVSDNKAAHDGGGIFNYGDVSLVDSTISQNRAKYSGGGVVNYGSLTISNSVISGNKARVGSDVFP